MGARRAPVRALAILALTAACGGGAGAQASDGRRPDHGPADPEATDTPDRGAEIASLRGVEEARRTSTDFADRMPWSARSGADPVAVLRLDARHWAGLERGRDALVVIDPKARTVQRLDAPARPTGLVLGPDQTVWVVGEGEPTIARYEVAGSRVTTAGAVRVPGSHGLRDVAAGPKEWIYVADRHRGRVRAVRFGRDSGSMPRIVEVIDAFDCAGALRVRVAGRHLLGLCMLDHRIVVAGLGPDGKPLDEAPLLVEHDGPMWSLDALEDHDGISLVVGGVEDRPLDRSDGAFGFIDSHVFAYRLERGPKRSLVRRSAAINVSAQGVITPKALWLRRNDDGFVVTVSGYGGDRMIELELDAALRWRGGVRTRAVPAGITAFEGDMGRGVAANPLLDAWVTWDSAGEEVVSVAHPDDERSPEERLGEALLFTRLMAPWNESSGRRSRFTCETCHFEGTVDGRTHYTGRGAVHATSKPLLGLFENRPHFSRALDRTLVQMVHNEFRVANLGADVDPWFTLSVDDAPWVRWLGVGPSDLSPVILRKSLMAFLMQFSHDPNPAASGRDGFNEVERRGAELFAEHCESCHRARLVADLPDSRVTFEEWEALVFGGGPIVWAEETRRRTGIEPLVHPDGARTPSLRRLWTKRPYFTNGSAPDLEAVLERALIGESFAHVGSATGGLRHLAVDEQRALAAFLDLL